MNSKSQNETLVLAKLLVGVGIVLMLASLGSWLGPLFLYPLARNNALVDRVTTTGMLCSGPFALLGALSLVIGGVLWRSHK